MGWKVEYSDGSSLAQYNEDGTVNTYRDIDREKLVSFSLSVFNNTYTVSLEDGRRLIYRQRVKVSPGKPDEVIYLLGWQKTVRGENIQSILFISKDEVISAGRWGQGMFSAPAFFEYE